MTITGPERTLWYMLSEDAFVRQVDAGEAGWVYDDAVWGLVWQDEVVALASADEAATEYPVNIFPAKCEKSDDGIFYSISEDEVPVDRMTFTNTYTKSAADPSDPEGTTNGDSDNDNYSKAAAEDSVKTGDVTNLALWIALMLISVAGIAGVTLYTRRKRTNK